MTDNRGIDAGQIRDRIQYIIDQLRLKPSSFADLCELPDLQFPTSSMGNPMLHWMC